MATAVIVSARNCQDARIKTCCEGGNCEVRTSPTTTCYCDAKCSDRNDCCSDIDIICSKGIYTRDRGLKLQYCCGAL